jgi:hypothetical protein
MNWEILPAFPNSSYSAEFRVLSSHKMQVQKPICDLSTYALSLSLL